MIIYKYQKQVSILKLMKKSLSKNKTYYIYIIALLITLLLSFSDSFFDFVLSFDENILKYLNSHQNPAVFSFMKSVSFIGSSKFLVPALSIATIILLVIKKYKESLYIIMASLGSLGLNSLIKNLIRRTRPVEYFLVEETSYSFPSGHAMIAASLSFTIAFLITRKKEGNAKLFSYTLASIYTLLMGFSRLYLGVHYPTDVIFGILYGLVVFMLINDLSFKL